MSKFIFAVAVFAVVGILSTNAAPLLEGAENSWNQLLLADNIFPSEKDLIHEGYPAVSSSNEQILNRLESLLSDKEFLLQLYKNYAELHSKTEVLQGNLRSLETFRETLLSIGKHNLDALKGVHTWTKGVTQFADMTFEEFHSMYAIPQTTMDSHRNSSSITYEGPLKTTDKTPSFVDWNYEGYLTPIKDQGTCCSCGTFAGTTMLESTYAILKGGKLVSLSPQEILDCQGTQNICKNGMYNNAVADYLYQYGVTSWDNYPYEGVQHTSCFANGKRRFAQAIGWRWLGENQKPTEEELKQAIARAPVWTSIPITPDVQHYRGEGVFQGECDSQPDHFVVIVGYGQWDGVDYYMIKNSWNTNWGRNGFMYLRKGWCRVPFMPIYVNV